jgi:hypothetical protein
MKTRAIRRHESDKRKRRAQALIRLRYQSAHLADDVFVGKLARTRTPCSCRMCGNPRKWFKQKTVQELKRIEVVS